jgi:hypothetical protein
MYLSPIFLRNVDIAIFGISDNFRYSVLAQTLLGSLMPQITNIAIYGNIGNLLKL